MNSQNAVTVYLLIWQLEALTISAAFAVKDRHTGMLAQAQRLKDLGLFSLSNLVNTFLQMSQKLFLRDARFNSQNASDSILALAPPQTPLGKLTALLYTRSICSCYIMESEGRGDKTQ